MSAGNGIIGALLVSLGVDTAAFDTGLKATEGKVGKFGAAISNLGGLAMAGLAAGVAVAGAAFIKFGTDSLSAADDIGDAAARLGIGAEAYQKLGIAATAAGGTPELMTEAMDKLNENMGAFIQNGGGKAADAFKQLGIAGQITSGQIKTADQAFYAAVRGMESIEDPALKARIAMELFGKSAGVDMLEVVGAGADGLIAFGEAGAQAGRVMSQELVDKLSAANQALHDTKIAAGQMATVMAGEAVVAIVDMAKSLSPLWEQAKALWSQVADFLMPSINELAAAFVNFAHGPAGQFFLEILREVGQLLGTVVVGAINLSIKAFTILFNVVDAVGKFIAGAINKMAGAFDWLRKVTGGLINIVMPVAPAFKVMATEVADKHAPAMVNGVEKQFKRLPQVMTAVVNKEAEKVKRAFEILKTSLNSVFSGLATPDESAEKDFLERIKVLDEARAKDLLDEKAYVEQVRRAREKLNESSYTTKDKFPLELGKADEKAIDISLPDIDANKFRAEQKQLFAETFSDGIMAALNGDLGNFFTRWWQQSLTKSLDSLGAKLFDLMGSITGKMSSGGIFGSIGSAFSSIFGNSPKFAQGGTVGFKGGGPVDSRLFSAWVSPSEIVNIGKPEDLSGGAMTLHVEPSPWFDVRARDASAPVAREYSKQATVSGARGGAALAQVEAARRQRSYME